MKSLKTESEQQKETKRYFDIKHTRDVTSGFLSVMVKSLMKNGYTRESASNFLKDIAEDLKQEKLFVEE
jgi:hypothetical protein